MNILQKLLLLFILAVTYSCSSLKIDYIDTKQSPKFTVKVNKKDKTVMSILDKEDFNKVLSIHLYNGDTWYKSNLSGKYTRKKNEVSFIPHVKLSNGTKLMVKYGNGLKKQKEYAIDLNYPPVTKIPTVKRMFPIRDTIPANIMSFYMEFNQPMRNDIFSFKKAIITNSDGKSPQHKWRSKSIWMSSKTLTLTSHHFMDMREIIATNYKNSIYKPNELFTITTEGIESNKNTFSKKYAKDYFILNYDSISPKFLETNFNNQIKRKENLVFSFNEAMDYGLLLSDIKVYFMNKEIQGEFLTKDDMHWEFKPSEKWKKGKYYKFQAK